MSGHIVVYSDVVMLSDIWMVCGGLVIILEVFFWIFTKLMIVLSELVGSQ